MAEIVLKNRDGDPVTIEGVTGGINVLRPDGTEGLYVDSADVPALIEGMRIELDFSGGDQHLQAQDGYAVKSAIIPKPVNLVPGNIAEGVNIAGVIGTLAAAGGGGLDEYNVFIRPWLAPASDNAWHTIATPAELSAAGITLYDKAEATDDHLWTMVVLSAMTPSAGRTKMLAAAVIQNTPISTIRSVTNTVGIAAYSDGSNYAKAAALNSSTKKYSIGYDSYPFPKLNITDGLQAFVSASHTFFPAGLHMAIVIQHKTKTANRLISDEQGG